MQLPQQQFSPETFFSKLRWLDGRPITSHIEPYRMDILQRALWTFHDPKERRRPWYNLVLAGRAKKNWKTTDLLLAVMYRLMAWISPLGNECYILANDLDQANDDLDLAKSLIGMNPEALDQHLKITKRQISRRDGGGFLEILPARDVVGSHGKTYLICAFDEIHGYRDWDILEALAPDPTRPDAMRWITSYSSLYNASGAPLYDLFHMGKAGTDKHMLFSWYDAVFTTDEKHAKRSRTGEEKANPSMSSWADDGYLEAEKGRLPTHKYRRLHLNLPGVPTGAAYNANRVVAAIPSGVRRRKRDKEIQYFGFVDMSGGSNDDAVLAIAHYDEKKDRRILDTLVGPPSKPPFDPRVAVKKFAKVLKKYHVYNVEGDKYAGDTFARDFESHGINYETCEYSKHELYEEFEPLLNAGEVELLDHPELELQLTTLVWRGRKIDHAPGAHDDYANAAVGALERCAESGTVEMW